MKKLLYLLVPAMVAVFATSCDKDDPEIPNEEELITTVTYTLTPQGGGDVVELKFKDDDGNGGKEPVMTVSGKLKAKTTYAGVITLLNESKTPAEDISKEVKEEDDEHQFFFASTVAGLEVIYNDKDDNEKPVGLKTTLMTNEAGQGTLKITLRHQPDKAAENVSAGDISNAGGETDIEVTFDIDVE